MLPLSVIIHFAHFAPNYLQLLWSADLGMHTVHVDDVCQAIWHVAEKAENGQVFNVVDKSSTSKINSTKAMYNDGICHHLGNGEMHSFLRL